MTEPATAAETADVGRSGRSIADLRADLARSDLARHLALFYESTDAQLAAVAAYVDRGLQAGHRCLYLVDDNDAARIRAALRSLEIDVDARIEAGDLAIRDASEVYLDAGFDPDRMIDELRAACEGSVADGYDGLWVAGENTWSFHTDETFDHVVDFEADFDACCPDLPVMALCQYDLRRFSGESAAKALWTHEQIVYRNAVCENPYYIPPKQYRSMADPQTNARLMLEQTYDLAQARRQIHRREQRLSVVTRVLRHNIRNDLNAIHGLLELVEESAGLDDAGRERLASARQCAEDVVDLAEKARYVERSIAEPDVERVALGSVVDRAVGRVADAHPDAEVAVTGDADVRVHADKHLDRALEEVVTNAVVHADADPPSVALRISAPSPALVRLDVRNPGGPIPEIDRRALRQEYETQLDHGSSLGLWLVKWIVENSGGSLSFPDDGDCQVRIELRRAFE
ncbi:MEDS domain-containing protein [Halostella litorea]|uniref:MEDS domain-containing protein n=1 Tax=Halostella litorea TaxID=2528831 RepID=UPI0010919A95|nr:MEDS domain-containing protein [Halostella litorea]